MQQDNKGLWHFDAEETSHYIKLVDALTAQRDELEKRVRIFDSKIREIATLLHVIYAGVDTDDSAIVESINQLAISDRALESRNDTILTAYAYVKDYSNDADMATHAKRLLYNAIYEIRNKAKSEKE